MNQPFPKTQNISRWSTFTHACLFVAGFSSVFIVGWGGAATLLGQVFTAYKSLLASIGGVVIIFFGLLTLGLFRMPWIFYKDTRYQWPNLGKSGV